MLNLNTALIFNSQFAKTAKMHLKSPKMHFLPIFYSPIPQMGEGGQIGITHFKPLFIAFVVEVINFRFLHFEI